MMKEILYNLIDEIDRESTYRGNINMLKDEDYMVSEIRMMATNLI